MFYCCGITEQGKPAHNEDALLIHRNVLTSGMWEQKISSPFIAAVSDGVSGERSGEVASAMCLGLVSEINYNSRMNLRQRLMEIHRNLAEYSNQDPENHNMQATLCGIAADNRNNIISFNVGDSRLYRFRRGRAEQLSRDQSLVQMLYDEGSITLEQKRTHVHRNVIFPVFGNVSTPPQIDITPVEGGMDYGDVLFLCTDGLSDYVTPLDMEEIMELPKSLPERLRLLVDKALEAGSKDNITAIAISVI